MEWIAWKKLSVHEIRRPSGAQRDTFHGKYLEASIAEQDSRDRPKSRGNLECLQY
ncbi:MULTISPECIES: hypothetical protein [unclassified Microbacterium]|uniref:hypothetical protein n=1 Tax=unclassified Microbacterium TaxID=2609290 RepID=UPI0015E3C820|nr:MULTISPECIES: hypothetical protein [unclassified Microbacterium]